MLTVFIYTYHSQLSAPPALKNQGGRLPFHFLVLALSSAKRQYHPQGLPKWKKDNKWMILESLHTNVQTASSRFAVSEFSSHENTLK